MGIGVGGRSLNLLYPPREYPSGIQERAWVHPKAQIDEGASILPMAHVGQAVVGAGTRVMPFAFIDDDEGFFNIIGNIFKG